MNNSMKSSSKDFKELGQKKNIKRKVMAYNIWMFYFTYKDVDTSIT